MDEFHDLSGQRLLETTGTAIQMDGKDDLHVFGVKLRLTAIELIT